MPRALLRLCLARKPFSEEYSWKAIVMDEFRWFHKKRMESKLAIKIDMHSHVHYLPPIDILIQVGQVGVKA